MNALHRRRERQVMLKANKNPRVIAALVLAILVICYLIFEFGRIQADYNIIEAANERSALQSTITSLEKEIVDLKQSVAVLETHRDIDKESYAVVEADLAGLQEKIQEQKEAIEFYRGIMSPKDGEKGLRVQDLRLTRGIDEQHYNLRLVLVQVKRHDRSVKGEIEFSVQGTVAGEETTFALEQLTPEDASGSWPFAFRYFQDFDRVLVLPDGFSPEQINVEVVSRTKSVAGIQQSFAWPVGQIQTVGSK